jgi:hypothetical protein
MKEGGLRGVAALARRAATTFATAAIVTVAMLAVGPLEAGPAYGGRVSATAGSEPPASPAARRLGWTAVTDASIRGSVPASPVPTGIVKYYIVRPPVNGQPEYLFDIAARTLGNGRRSGEIFDLNRGRVQSDGSALVDPAVLHPGWVLLLPADASGPDVITGPFPTTNVPRSTSPAPRPPSGSASADLAGELGRGLGTGVIVAIMIVAIYLLRRGRRLEPPVWIRSRFGRIRPVPRTQTGTSPGTAPHQPDLVPGPPVVVPAARTQPHQPDLVPDPPVVVPAARTRRQAGPTAGDDLLEARLTAASGLDPVEVRLTGVRLPRATPAWLWLDVDTPGPPAATFVAVGATDGEVLCLDLLQAPDVLTVAGEQASARRLAATFARQLVDQQVPVTIVGQSVGPRVAGSHTVRSLAEAESATEDPSAPAVIFCASGQNDSATLRRLIGRSSPRTVVILVGDVRRGRWSIEMLPQT